MASISNIRKKSRDLFVSSRFPQKPELGTQYDRWLEDRFDYNVGLFGHSDYAKGSFELKRLILGSSFWKEIVGNGRMETIDREYLYRFGFPLFATLQKPKLLIKTFESLLGKTHRFNVKENENWPMEPKLGWVSPYNWLEKVNDVVRCQIICRDSHGAIFLAEQLKLLADRFRVSSMPPRHLVFDDGYYAIHFYITIKGKILIPSRLRSFILNGKLEIQVTTQMHEAVKQLLHYGYRKNRNKLCKINLPWQWDFKQEDFVRNFLGHSIQNIDGTICRLRYKYLL